MQIVSQATFERLRQTPLLHTSTHNRIAYVTPSHLVLRQITLAGKTHQLKLKGTDILAISLENSNLVVLVYRSGLVEVRKIDSLNQVSVHCQVVLGDTIPKVRVSGEAVYVLGKNCIETIFLVKEKGRKQVYLSEAKEEPKDLLISSIFQEQIILVQYPSSIALTAEGKNIAEAPFEEVGTFKLLKDPLVLEAESKEFLILVEARKYLKVFDIFDLEPILQMQLVLEQNQDVQLKIDPLHEYLIMRYYNPQTKQTNRNHLLRVNTDFYKGTAHQPFFLFDIEIGLKEDFILFPTHKQFINNVQFFSIDMCFFAAKEIRIATLVVDTSYRTKLTHVNYANASWVSHSSWKDFFFQSKEPINQKPTQLEYQNKTDDWQLFLEKFYQQNLQKLKCENLYKVKNQNLEEIKYLQYEDALNTLSGSSSFGSLKEVPCKRALPYGRRAYEEGDNISSEEEWRSKHEQKQQNSFDSQQSEQDGYLRQVQDEIQEAMEPVDTKTEQISQHLDRIQNVHSRKLKNMEKTIRHHRKEVNKIDKNIEKWCFEQFQKFGTELKDSLKEYGSMVGRLQIVEMRTVRKLKKHYRDHLQLELERYTEKLQDSENKLTQIEQLAQRQSKKKLY